MPDRSLERETAPIVRPPATRGAPSQEPGGARPTASRTVAGRKAAASSWASVVRRASNSGAGRGVAGLEGGLGMILANVRGRLRAQDFLLVALALAHGDTARRARYERQLLEEGPDELLDEPGLLAALPALRP